MGASCRAGAGAGIEGGVELFASRLQWLRHLLRMTQPERDVEIKLNPDATFAFPYGDGY
jgi:hypothetical protein